MIYDVTSKGIILHDTSLNLKSTFECGQCFRFDLQKNGSYIGVAGRRLLHARQKKGVIYLYHMTEKAFLNFWENYFDLTFDYDALQKDFLSDHILRKTLTYSRGIHILKQDHFEALCSFILSSNNHIKRIKGMIRRLCEICGDPIGGGYYAFPTPEKIADFGVRGLEELRAGYRLPYLIDAAEKVAAGHISLEAIGAMPIAQAREKLRSIKGVGPKVADCILLYGFHRLEAFPIDVWMKRVLKLYYPMGFTDDITPYKGIAQQYLFHYARQTQLK